MAGALRALVILMAMLMTMTCGSADWGWSEAVVQGGDSALGLSVTWSEAPEVRGWLYTYGLSWQRCPEPSLAERLGLEGVAKASHPVAFDGEGQWRWHATIEVGEAGSERLEMRLEPGTYCGLRWLFSHGGLPRDGVLASMQLDAEGETFALSSHAATVALAFDAPVCVGEEVPEFTLTLDMGAWIAGFRERTNPALAARDGWLSMADYLSTSASPCP